MDLQKRVLVVDDESSNLIIIQEALNTICDVTICQSPKEAISLAETLSPQIILLDIEMPEMNGFTLCERLQAMPQCKASRFIFITSHNDHYFEKRALSLGAIDFIPKPINIDICSLRIANQLALLAKEYELNKAKNEIEKEREYLDTILQSIGDAVIATDESGGITFINPVAQRITGWAQRDALGVHIEQVMKLTDASSNVAMVNPLSIALKQKRPVAMALNAKLTTPLGSEHRVEDSASPIFDESGNVVGGVMVFQDVTESIAMATQMSHLTNHDQLTGLPNRMLLHDRMLQAISNAALTNQHVAVLLIDVDNFKYINDSLGHQTGDLIISHVARRLEVLAGTTTTVSRIGGDEFAVLLKYQPNVPAINAFASQLVAIGSEPFAIEGEEHRLSLSIGISVYPHDANNPEELMRHADAAMYKAKRAGKNGYKYFSADLHDELKERVVVEKKLHQALQNEELVVHYQPKYALDSQAIIGAEALVRMQDEDGNLIYPDAFINVAEDAGLIIELGQQVLWQACRQAKQWLDKGIDIKIAVNIGAAQFNQTDFNRRVEKILRECQLPSKNLELEITESALISNFEKAKQSLMRLKAIGVSIALDDFGTGYSSLSYLKNFEIDVLKIDRSFVQDMETDPQAENIVRAIINLAQTLKLELVCEGIETEAQQTLLQSLGCSEGQGYLFSKPIEATQFDAMLHKVPCSL